MRCATTCYDPPLGKLRDVPTLMIVFVIAALPISSIHPLTGSVPS
jgi:hypothetical protein